ncbi:unnamed protein product [Effrenium voratum]|nr:unnamed protein product [Effrenium voratum]
MPVQRPKMSEVAAGLADEGEVPELLRWARSQHSSGALVRLAPGLYLGNRQAAADRQLLDRAGIASVCAIGAKAMFQDLKYHRVPVEDDGGSMLQYLDAACDFVHEERQRGHVLVHCQGGIARSPCLAVAYLMKHEQLSLPHALELCSLARPAARCPRNFQDDLEAFALRLKMDAPEPPGAPADAPCPERAECGKWKTDPGAVSRTRHAPRRDSALRPADQVARRGRAGVKWARLFFDEYPPLKWIERPNQKKKSQAECG